MKEIFHCRRKTFNLYIKSRLKTFIFFINFFLSSFFILFIIVIIFQKFLIKSALKLFEFDFIFKDNYIIYYEVKLVYKSSSV